MSRRKAPDPLMLVIEDLMEHPEKYPEEIVLLPFDPRRLSSLFTPERLRLWRELRRSRPASISELARRLGRDVSRVRQDVLVLQGARLVESRRVGTRVRVYSRVRNVLVAGPA